VVVSWVGDDDDCRRDIPKDCAAPNGSFCSCSAGHLIVTSDGKERKFTGFRRIQIDKHESSLCWSANLTRRLFGRNVKYELGFERTKLAGANGRKD
jgi:hypothetical protein